ncbi:protein wnt [Plakobranchus ocellatus]|uniref:Protein Wnt n=1 Tax=Plakobranchus ocellatus TaxID=259542 RepID=A0AAV4A5M1_9GAST|nr:protein wnt [Plakobranchus ocellatus]
MSWYLGIASLAGSVQDDTCNQVPGLVQQQLQVCRENPESLHCISEGARRGILECQSQFRFERWNCTTQRNYTVFGPILRKALPPDPAWIHYKPHHRRPGLTEARQPEITLLRTGLYTKTKPPLPRGVGGTVASESAQRSAGTLLAQVRASPRHPGLTEGLKA